MALRRKKNRTVRIDFDIDNLNYKDVDILSKFTSHSGKILGRRMTGVSASRHRRVVRAIKRARALGLMPFNG